jgi:hypothetical protein
MNMNVFVNKDDTDNKRKIHKVTNPYPKIESGYETMVDNYLSLARDYAVSDDTMRSVQERETKAREEAERKATGTGGVPKQAVEIKAAKEKKRKGEGRSRGEDKKSNPEGDE